MRLRELSVVVSLLLPCTLFAQSNLDQFDGQTMDDVQIVGIVSIDTIYLIVNPRINNNYLCKKLDADMSACYFYSDSLIVPEDLRKNRFSKNIHNDRVFYPCGSTTIVRQFVMPHLTDVDIYKWVDSSYSNIWYPQKNTADPVRLKKCSYRIVTFNTSCFLTVKIKASAFNEIYNQIYNPPWYILNKDVKHIDEYVRFLIPLIPKGNDAYIQN